ncbi:MAG: DUF488 domain-containing protein [Terricaulis sp.]|jgi:uncharacterized protein (DUF488 family)
MSTEITERLEVYTVGHSTLAYDEFRDLLLKAEITAIADVRSSPTSRHFPHFQMAPLKDQLREDKIAYVFLGKELGGRPRKAGLYSEGVADYEKMETTSEFRAGLDRVIEGAQKYRIALMCSEQDPLDCHRCLLVSRALKDKGISVQHILPKGRVISHIEIEERLLGSLDPNDDLFENASEKLNRAYRKQSTKVAYRSDRASTTSSQVAAE